MVIPASRHASFPEELNPIFEFAAKGQYYENRMKWQDSVHWYHRALTCLPNLFGANKKIRPLDLPHFKSTSFKPQHAGRLYAALGHALEASGRHWDSILAYQAAAALDPDNGNVTNALVHLMEVADPQMAEHTMLPGNPDDGGTWTRSALKEDITLMMVTHCTQDLEKFAALSPPSIKLVTATYGSLLRVFGDGIQGCPKIMCYDMNPNGGERDTQYTQSIEAFCNQTGFSLHRFQGVGLFNVLNQAIQLIDTPYIFFVEHDWMFRGERLMLPAFIEIMNNDPNINAIRFNKRENHLNGQDFLMSIDTFQRRYPMLRTSSFSNNPSIIRTEKLKNDWLPMCETALRRVSESLGGSAFGVEEILFRKYVQDIRAHGFQRAHLDWGMYVFGRVGDPPRLTHLGE